MKNDILKDNPLMIVDIGASGGIDSRWGNITSSYRGILFEPDPREFEKLKIKEGGKSIVLNTALSDSTQTLNFHLCEKQEVSSVYIPNINFLRLFPESN